MFSIMSHPAKSVVGRIGTWAALAARLLLPAAALAGGLPPGLVYLRDVDPSIAQDMRYAGPNNFTGRPLPGYDAAECVLRREAAEALARVQADLAAQNLGLKVYDCYRPTRAVAAFARWAQERRRRRDQALLPHARQEPAVRRRLYRRAFGAFDRHRRRSHTGCARRSPRAAFDAHATYGACTGPVAQRAPDNSLDMGTGFDCFDDNSRTASSAIAPEQARLRGVLVAAMRKRGFHNYFREWWHFSFGPRPAQAFDFVIEAR